MTAPDCSYAAPLVLARPPSCAAWSNAPRLIGRIVIHRAGEAENLGGTLSKRALLRGGV